MIFKLTLLYCAILWVQACGDFYWRDYNGVVPEDALKFSSIDERWMTSFIGRALVDSALIPGIIFQDKRAIDVVYENSTRTADFMVQILCAPDPKRFFWVSADSEGFHEQTEGFCLVQGGGDPGAAKKRNITSAPIYIGMIQGTKLIGNIVPYYDHIYLYYIHSGSVYSTAVYDVLAYSDIPKSYPNL